MNKIKIIKLDVSPHDKPSEPMFNKTLDWENIFQNLTIVDCNFIMSQLHKNFLFSEEIVKTNLPFDKIEEYRLMYRGTNLFLDITVSDSKGDNGYKKFYMFYDKISNMLDISLGSMYPTPNCSAIILIYEYFKNKSHE